MTENELPRRVKRVSENSIMYGLKIKPELKRKLEELKLFHGIDVPSWLRQIIEREVNSLEYFKPTVDE